MWKCLVLLAVAVLLCFGILGTGLISYLFSDSFYKLYQESGFLYLGKMASYVVLFLLFIIATGYLVYATADVLLKLFRELRYMCCSN